MHIDLDLSVNSLPSTSDFCVVGSGPAGITLALALGDMDRTVILLEGGGFSESDESQDIYKGDVIGDPYFDLNVARLRYLGGTSGHWGGWCIPLHEFDFRKKEGFEDAHWPIEKKDLDPFFLKACSILDIPQPANEAVIDSEFGIKETHISMSPVHFGEKYRDKIKSSKNVSCVTHANLTGLNTDGQRVLSATITNFGGRSASVKAKYFIFAMGGIENSRMLMWCNHQAKGKVVDPAAPLGRYWMEHLNFRVGEAVIDLKLVEPDLKLRFVGLTEVVRRKLSILDCRIMLKEIPRGGEAQELLRDLLCVAPRAGKWLAARVNKKLACGAKLIAEWEQEPIWDNHVGLSETKRDRFGIPLTELHWKKTDRDLATVQKTFSHFNDYVMSRNLGRIKFVDWMVGKGGFPDFRVTGDDGGSYHHMGGTRMALTAEKGVVDTNCRVFGQTNLYIAGSSVFPSGGSVNPTLSIVQLSLRLAEHLRHA